jgi:hypothetical protein
MSSAGGSLARRVSIPIGRTSLVESDILTIGVRVDTVVETYRSAEMPWPSESLKEQLKSWKAVVQTCDEEGNKAGPKEKDGWLAARVAAQGMVEKLTELVKMEKLASKAFFNARTKKPVLKLVSNGD